MNGFFRRPAALAAAAAAFLLSSFAAAAEPPRVAASIAPLHSLAAMVTAGVSEPYLLVRGGASPHSYALSPSDSRSLSEAALVVWVGEGLEGFLAKPLSTLARRARTLELSENETLTHYDRRTTGVWREDDGDPAHRHDHDHGHDRGHAHGSQGHEHHGRVDPHLWLHTRNAEAILLAISAALSDIDPANAAVYRANAAAGVERMRTLHDEIDAQLASVRDRPFIVFHDAWQYFEREFQLTAAGAIALDPERKPGARTLVAIRARIVEARVRCVFSEPQFSPSLVKTVIRETSARSATLDPLGADLDPGPDLYPQLMRNLAAGLSSCLRNPRG